MRITSALGSVAMLLAASATPLCAQSALDGFDPSANGLIRAVVVQPDGKILLGGDFTSLAPNGGPMVTRNRIARLNPDGTLDGFNPNASNSVYAIAVQADGKILAGGMFSDIGGETRNRIARLDPITGLADSFNPTANNTVFAIVVQADGKIVIGGDFNGANSIGGQPRNRIARLDPATGLADSFNANADLSVFVLALQADGRILAGGKFTSIGGQTRIRMARLDPASGLADAFNPTANNAVLAIAVQADGKILAGGSFSGTNSIGSQARNRIARLDPATGLADPWNPTASGDVNAIAVQPDGMIVAGGAFTTVGGQTRNRIARLDRVTGLADSFDPSANSDVMAIAVQADGKIVAGGAFLGANSVGTQTRNRIVRLETDGGVDQTLNAFVSIPGLAQAIVVQRDGKILIGGQFANVLGISRNNIARLNRDGTLDSAFNPSVNGPVRAIAVQVDGKVLIGGTFNGVSGQIRSHIARLDSVTGVADSWDPNSETDVTCLAAQPDGKILAGGFFHGIGGQGRNGIARLNPVTGGADSFDPNADNGVYSLALQSDGKILVGGDFSMIGAQPRNHIARLDAAIGLADSFDPNANSTILALAIQQDGKVLAGGIFNGANSIGGAARNRIARLDPATSAADSFDPNANGEVDSIVVQADGSVLAGGHFTGPTSIGGQARNRLARLDPATGLADSFDPNASGDVLGIALSSDGKILVAGFYSGANSIGGQTRDSFARLTNNKAALQNLVVTPDAVTWTRGGSSPQFTRVTFESSSDNVNYTALGSGIPQSGSNNWSLTGLNLATGQNLYIRARGYYRSGYRNGSESTEESVRNVFLTLPPAPAQVVSRKLHAGSPFDINLPLAGTPGVECRSGGASNDYQIVLTFPSSVTFTQVAVSSGAGSVSGTAGYGTNTVVVNLTGVTSAQTISVKLTGVSDGNTTGDLIVSLAVLIGDTNGDRFVNAGDALQTRNRAGQATDATNFRSDVNIDGTINSGDTIAVRSRSGSALP